MKRTYLFIILALVVAIAAAGCSQAATEESETPTPTPIPTATPEPTPEPIPDEWPVVDTDELTLTISDTSTDKDGSYIWSLDISNKSGSNVMLRMTGASLNGLACDPDWGLMLEPDASVATDVLWKSDRLTSAGITGNIVTAAFHLTAYNADDAEADNYLNDDFTVALIPGKTGFTYEVQPDDIVVLDTDEAAMIITSIAVRDDGEGVDANVVLINKSDYAIRFAMPDTVINDYEFVSATMDETVPAHTTCMTGFGWVYSYDWGYDMGYLDADGELLPDMDYTLNMKFTNADDITADALLNEGMSFVH